MLFHDGFQPLKNSYFPAFLLKGSCLFMLFHPSKSRLQAFENSSYRIVEPSSKKQQMLYDQQFHAYFCSVLLENGLLEYRQYTNDTGQSKKMQILKLPRFFTRLYGEWKRAVNSNFAFSLTTMSRSCTAFTLRTFIFYSKRIILQKKQGNPVIILTFLASNARQNFPLLTLRQFASHMAFS